MPLRRELIDEAIIVPVRHVVEVLHADDLDNGLSLGHLLGSNVAQDRSGESVPDA